MTIALAGCTPLTLAFLAAAALGVGLVVEVPRLVCQVWLACLLEEEGPLAPRAAATALLAIPSLLHFLPTAL